jgi:uncharacterized membrane protein YdjX (TVP38/TMEM64 family)
LKIAVLYLLIIIILIINRDSVIIWLDEGHTLPFFLVIIITFLFAFFRVIPYGVVTGYLGAQYGWFLGGIVSSACATGAAIVLFFLTRHIFSDKGRNFIKKYKPADSFTSMVERNAFLAVLIGRLTPLLPSQVISVYAALSSMSSVLFIAATILGKIPLAVVYALFGEQIRKPDHLLQTGVIYMAFLLIVYGLYNYWTHRIEKGNA